MGRKIAGWVVSGLIAAFMILDGGMKLAKPAPVVEAFARTGWPMDLSVTLGVILLGCTVLYLIPKTSVLGAILLTGYLGGAVATNLRLHNPAFNTWFPVVFGVLAWIGVWLRERKVGQVFPVC
jgi:DoxX-like protein